MTKRDRALTSPLLASFSLFSLDPELGLVLPLGRRWLTAFATKALLTSHSGSYTGWGTSREEGCCQFPEQAPENSLNTKSLLYYHYYSPGTPKMAVYCMRVSSHIGLLYRG